MINSTSEERRVKSEEFKLLLPFKGVLLFFILHSSLFALLSCQGEQERMPATISAQDSTAFMRSRGISTLISDSGVLRYKLVAEEWDIYTITNPPTWKFMKGMLMERFDEQFHIDLHVEADTAYLHEQRLWELRGRVVIHNVEGTLFRTEELFWDMNEHKIWSTQYMRIKTTDQELEGTDFRSNEQMTDYYVSNSIGAFPVSDVDGSKDEPTTPADTSAAVATTRNAATATPIKNKR
ncbi:MAG: LPS export ABC transporter periplasmic protein LptC [Bacteroidaceae bacterium]|nr:LPS export ABC transporter periplasmic protein LptC [Bacteroidaceae bacterium]